MCRLRLSLRTSRGKARAPDKGAQTSNDACARTPTVNATPSLNLPNKESVVSSVFAVCIKHLLLAVPARVNKYLLSLGEDTGYYVNVLPEAPFYLYKGNFEVVGFALGLQTLTSLALKGLTWRI